MDMQIDIICFTLGGYELMNKINRAVSMDFKTELFCKCSALKGICECKYVDESISEWADRSFQKGSALLFIGAAGIAVRAIKGCIDDKLSDSPVLVMDEKGQYIIPILSGHYGRANELAHILADRMGCQAVITTATDVNERFAVDVFARDNNLCIVEHEGIAKISSKVLRGEKLIISGDIFANEQAYRGYLQGIEADFEYIETNELAGSEIDIWIGENSCYENATLNLLKKRYILGVGCKKDKPYEDILKFVLEKLEEANINPKQILVVASIDVKKDEKGILGLAKHFKVPYMTYSAEELMKIEGEFSGSDFVKSQVGVDCVCERAAIRYLLEYNKKNNIPLVKPIVDFVNQRLIMKKNVGDGVTLAISKMTDL